LLSRLRDILYKLRRLTRGDKRDFAPSSVIEFFFRFKERLCRFIRLEREDNKNKASVDSI